MNNKTLAGAHVLLVIAPTEFRDEEFLEPKRILSDAGALLTVASTKNREATGMLGAKVTPDTTIDEVKDKDFQAVIVVGGMGSPEYLWDNAALHTILQRCAQNNQVAAAICLSGAVLAKAGVLKGKQATVYATPESLKALESGGAKYIKQHVVRDGNIVTADGPEAAREFGNTIVTALTQKPVSA